MNSFLRLVAAGAVLGALFLGWAVVVEPQLLITRHVDIVSADWPQGRAPLRLALIADLHTGSLWNGPDNIRRVVERVNTERPDIILLLGDFVTTRTLAGSFVPPEVTADVLADLKAPLGVYAVLGNHDWWFDGLRVGRALQERGIAVLEHSIRVVGSPDGPFVLIGVPDDTTRPRDMSRLLADVPQGLPQIVMTHDPAVFVDVPPRGIAVTFAAHTHGGQVYLPFIGAPIVPGRSPRRWASGHVIEGGRHLFVSTGIGTSVLPVRFNMPPATEIVTLRSAAPGSQ